MAKQSTLVYIFWVVCFITGFEGRAVHRSDVQRNKRQSPQLTPQQKQYVEQQLQARQLQQQRQRAAIAQQRAGLPFFLDPARANPSAVRQAKDIYDYRNTSPYGPFSGGAGYNSNDQVNVFGSGYRDKNSVSAGWPQGVQTDDGVDAYALGNRVAYFPDSFNLSPANSIAEYNIGVRKGYTVLNSGYIKDSGGHAGISGYSWGDRHLVPVLGTNVVDHHPGSGLDITGFNFASGTHGRYGPVEVMSDTTSISSPWLGQIISRGIYDGAFKEAGYDSGVPGGVLPGAGIPGVPFVG